VSADETLSKLGEKIQIATLDALDGAVKLTTEQIEDLGGLTSEVASALAGDERAQAHLEAEFALRKFSVEARAYVESVEFRKALTKAIGDAAEDLVKEGLVVGAQVVAKLLIGALAAQ
jgi:hypothetical protein